MTYSRKALTPEIYEDLDEYMWCKQKVPITVLSSNLGGAMTTG